MNIGVIGGGAAGIFAAIRCKELYPDCHVFVLERGAQVLTKVKISGGGRCNVTHACYDPKQLTEFYPRGAKALRSVFARFHPGHTTDWFRSRGVSLKTEPDGRIFPVSDDSQTIIDCLLGTARSLGVGILTKMPVESVSRDGDGFMIHLADRTPIQANRLILATGSSPVGYEIAACLGHSIVPPVPSLFTFTIPDPDLTQLSGVSVADGIATLPTLKLKQSGPILITHWGISGPGIIKLSAWGARELGALGYETQLVVNWLPGYTPEKLDLRFKSMRQDAGAKQVRNANPFSPLSIRLWQYLLQKAEIADATTWATLNKQMTQRLQNALVQSEYKIAGRGQFKDEFVTAGGVSLNEIEFKTMQSRICPNLFFAGEVIDIDGITGGFNF
ncbi:NAD(P)/FAD-dependent oxidoreductase, partial [bacterium]|nr:NAD(P)/FAD-dependent oxidoreductase [bacterium]